MHVWKKRVLPAQVEPWTERLAVLMDPVRLVVVEPPNGRFHRLEVYFNSEREAGLLVEQFGGAIREVCPEDWQPSPVTAAGKPLKVGGRLLVTSREEELAPLRQSHPDRHVLCIPAAMAFGTGEHATTAMCLRLLLAVSRRHAPGAWDVLDLGTGSGILALAGIAFGAGTALGVDHDPHAVRTARENARLNGVGLRQARFEQVELPAWRNRPARVWPVVTANLFSELLIRLLPEIIAPAVAPGGDLILSGVLATQAAEVVAAVEQSGLQPIRTKPRGRWRAFHCRRPMLDAPSYSRFQNR